MAEGVDFNVGEQARKMHTRGRSPEQQVPPLSLSLSVCVFQSREIYASNLFDDMSMWTIILYLGVILQVINADLVVVMRRGTKTEYSVGVVTLVVMNYQIKRGRRKS
jgi:hypothetical protein